MKCLVKCVNDFIDNAESSNPTINLQFKAYKSFKDFLFNYIDFDMNTVNVDFEIETEFVNMKRCLKLNILGYENIQVDNTKIKMFDNDGEEVQFSDYLIEKGYIYVFLDKLCKINIEFLIVVHKLANGKTLTSPKYFIKVIN